MNGDTYQHILLPRDSKQTAPSLQPGLALSQHNMTCCIFLPVQHKGLTVLSERTQHWDTTRFEVFWGFKMLLLSLRFYFPDPPHLPQITSCCLHPSGHSHGSGLCTSSDLDDHMGDTNIYLTLFTQAVGTR